MPHAPAYPGLSLTLTPVQGPKQRAGQVPNLPFKGDRGLCGQSWRLVSWAGTHQVQVLSFLICSTGPITSFFHRG